MKLAALLFTVALTAQAQQLPAARTAQLDAIVQKVIADTGVPSASVGIVQGGQIVYTQAYGDARLQPELKATASMAYPIGSISKQFTAACILSLQRAGVLKLDDPVARWFPELTRASDITLRMLLSHTSGYSDYAPQDYTIPAWTVPTDPARLIHEWAGKPLDFEPGTQWQYSNTNFVLAALIVQKAAGVPYFTYLREHVLAPAGLQHALNLDTERNQVQVQGYERRALAPLRPAILEAPGWYFGDASLAMPVRDLLTWDLAVLALRTAQPDTYAAFATPTKLKDGKPTRYSLGMSVINSGGHFLLEHSGEVGGFVAENMVFPDDNLAITVLTNQEASSAAQLIAKALAQDLLQITPKAPAGPTPIEQQLTTIVTGLQAGQIDRTLFTPDANFYFSPETLGDFQSSLAPLGRIATIRTVNESLRGGMTARTFTVTFPNNQHINLSTYTMPDDRYEQLLVEGTN